MFHPAGSSLAFGLYVAVLLVSAGVFAHRMHERWALLSLARPIPRSDRKGTRWKGIARYFVGQSRILSPRYLAAGAMHALIFWGFLAVSIDTIHFLVDGFAPGVSIPGLGPEDAAGRVYLWVRDVFEVAVLAMVVAAVVRRVVLKPTRLTLSGDAILILTLIGLLMATDLWLAGAETAGVQIGRAHV